MRDIIYSWKDKFPSRIGRILGNGLLFGVFITKENSEEPDFDLNKLYL